MIPPIQPWLYVAISETTLGDGYKSISRPLQAVILNCSGDRRYLQIYDMKYSCIAIVEDKNQLLQAYSKNSTQELVGCIINIDDFHFLCTSCNTEGYDKYLFIYINRFSIIPGEKLEIKNSRVKDVMELGSVSGLLNLYPIGLIGMDNQDTCSYNTVNGDSVLRAIFHQSSLPETLPQSQNGTLLLSQIPITQDSIGNSTPSKERIVFSNISQEGSDGVQQISQLLTQPPSSSVSQGSDLPLGQSMSPSLSYSHSQDKIQSQPFSSSQEKIPSQSSNLIIDKSQPNSTNQSQDKIPSQSFCIQSQFMISNETSEESNAFDKSISHISFEENTDSFSFGHNMMDSPNLHTEATQDKPANSIVEPSQDQSLNPQPESMQEEPVNPQPESMQEELVNPQPESMQEEPVNPQIESMQEELVNPQQEFSQDKLMDIVVEPSQDNSSIPSQDKLQQPVDSTQNGNSPSVDSIVGEEKSLLDQLLEDSSITEEESSSKTEDSDLDRSVLLDKILEENDDDSSTVPSHDNSEEVEMKEEEMMNENQEDVKQESVKPEIVEQESVEQEDVEQEDVEQEDVKQEDVKQEDVKPEIVEPEIVEQEDVEQLDEIINENQEIENQEIEKQETETQPETEKQETENQQEIVMDIETDDDSLSEMDELSPILGDSSNIDDTAEDLFLLVKNKESFMKPINETKNQSSNNNPTSVPNNKSGSVYDITELSSSSSSDHEIDDFVDRCTRKQRESSNSSQTDSSRQDFMSETPPSVSQHSLENSKKRGRIEEEEKPAKKRNTSTRDLLEKAVDNVQDEIAFSDSNDFDEQSFLSSVIDSDIEITEEVVNKEISSAKDIQETEKQKTNHYSTSSNKEKKGDKHEITIVQLIDTNSDSDSNEWESRWGY